MATVTSRDSRTNPRNVYIKYFLDNVQSPTCLCIESTIDTTFRESLLMKPSQNLHLTLVYVSYIYARV